MTVSIDPIWAMVYGFFHLLCRKTYILVFPTCDSILHRKLATSFLWLFLSVYLTIQPICPHGKTWLPLDGLPWNLSIFQKSVHKSQVSWKSDETNEHFTWRPKHVLITSHSFLRKTGNVSDKSCRENQNTHFTFSNFLSQIVLFMR